MTENINRECGIRFDDTCLSDIVFFVYFFSVLCAVFVCVRVCASEKKLLEIRMNESKWIEMYRDVYRQFDMNRRCQPNASNAHVN